MLARFEKDFQNLSLSPTVTKTFTHSFSFLSNRTRILYLINQTDKTVFVHFGLQQDKSQGFNLLPHSRNSFCLCYIYERNLHKGPLKTARFGVYSNEFLMEPLYLPRCWRKIYVISSMFEPKSLLELSYNVIHPSKARYLPLALKKLFEFNPRNCWFEYRFSLTNNVLHNRFFICACGSSPCELIEQKDYEQENKSKSVKIVQYK